ncbi:MAG TPA: type II toxin-antitoxin system VapC family toxin [Solirubrobacteraceae bacterium]|nr:type II toxin-antitoxin system VapC family toxin [Solirubrobacteraceae bacterium]
MQIVDANVLLYAVNERSVHHRPARAWLDRSLSGGETVGFAWVALLAFLRLSTHAAVFPRPLEPSAASDVAKQWLQSPGAIVLRTGRRHLALLSGFLREAGTAGNLVNDAHLAALAVEHDAEIASYDGDFARFSGVRWHQPS